VKLIDQSLEAASSDKKCSADKDIYTADSVHKANKKAGAEVYKECKHWDHSV
jgi:hypothetical protein